MQNRSENISKTVLVVARPLAISMDVTGPWEVFCRAKAQASGTYNRGLRRPPCRIGLESSVLNRKAFESEARPRLRRNATARRINARAWQKTASPASVPG